MDVEKTMQFILEMQARHEATIQQILEAQGRHEAAMQQLDERLNRVSALSEANTARIGQLVDVCASLANHGEETDRRFRETDFKLNALIETVDKLIRHNGSQH
jgi:uncharacterized membrane protein YccC